MVVTGAMVSVAMASVDAGSTLGAGLSSESRAFSVDINSTSGVGEALGAGVAIGAGAGAGVATGIAAGAGARGAWVGMAGMAGMAGMGGIAGIPGAMRPGGAAGRSGGGVWANLLPVSSLRRITKVSPIARMISRIGMAMYQSIADSSSCCQRIASFG